MADIATLGIRVDATQAENASRSLDKLSESGKRAEQSTANLGRQSDVAAQKSRLAAQAEREWALAQQQRAARQRQIISQSLAQREFKSLEQLAAAQTKVAGASGAAHAGLGRLNQSLVAAVERTTGANTALAHLGYSLGAFTTSAALMSGVLLGIAALGFAWNKLTEDTRKAREELERAKKALQDLRREQEQGPGGSTAQDVRDLQTRANQIRANIARLDAGKVSYLDWLFGGTTAGRKRQLEEELAGLVPLIAAGKQKVRQEYQDAADNLAADQKRENERRLKELEAQLKKEAELARKLLLGANVTAPTLPASPFSAGSGLDQQALNNYQRLQEAQRKVADGTIILFTNMRRLTPEIEDTSAAVERASHSFTSAASNIAAAAAGLVSVYGAGYAAGGSTTSRAGGALRGGFAGATTGAAIGSVIPGVGTLAGGVIGGLVGAIGGIFGASNKAKQAEEARRQAIEQLIIVTQQAINQEKIRAFEAKRANEESARSLELDIKAREAALSGNARDEAIARAQQRANDELAAAQKLLQEGAITEEMFQRLADVLGGELNQALADIAKQAAEAAQQIQDQADQLTLRGLTAAGRGPEAFLFGQAIERGQAGRNTPELLGILDVVQGIERTNFFADQAIADIKSGLDDQLTALDQQIAVARQQLAVQEQSRRAMLQVRDSLKEFNDSLLTGPYSPLSPGQQLQSSQSQFRGLAALARAGDLTAAQSFQGSAQTYLDALRAYYGSSGGYVTGFNEVRSTITGVTNRLGRAAGSGGDAGLSALIAIREAAVADAQRQIDAIEAQRKQAQDDAFQQLQVLNEQTGVLQEGFSGMFDRLDALETALRNIGTAAASASEIDRSRQSAVGVG